MPASKSSETLSSSDRFCWEPDDIQIIKSEAGSSAEKQQASKTQAGEKDASLDVHMNSDDQDNP